jgi:DNA-directed RNA polymerase subunit RPC12/RpoP
MGKHLKTKDELRFMVCPRCGGDEQVHEPGRYVCLQCGAAPERVDEPTNKRGEYPKAMAKWIEYSKHGRKK